MHITKNDALTSICKLCSIKLEQLNPNIGRCANCMIISRCTARERKHTHTKATDGEINKVLPLFEMAISDPSGIPTHK